ncbi:hypothetical protein DL769_006037 [Monosporascus sp. CRB-8-3]|nr:hypothetical protein DL769_006037 [Monosporascus sp. CRB-8-3]
MEPCHDRPVVLADFVLSPLSTGAFATSWQELTCAFQPSSAAELQEEIPVIVAANGSFAVRSGGCNPAPAAANIDNGVLIDLSSFNGVEYEADSNVVVIGAGLKWDAVCSQLEQYNVIVVGRRNLDVGVGSLILEGELMTTLVILADGSLVNANAGSHPDLLWAPKGGGNKFGTFRDGYCRLALQSGLATGIVTPFTLSAYLVPDILGGVKGYADDEFVCAATEDVIGEVDKASEAEASYVRYLSINDADHKQDVIASYREEDVGRLRDIQPEYDPDRVLQRLVPGGFGPPRPDSWRLQGMQLYHQVSFYFSPS